MDAAPPVEVVVGPDRSARVAVAALAAASAASFAAWLLDLVLGRAGAPTVSAATPLLVAAAAACAGGLAWRASAGGTARLAWDGRDWTLCAPGDAAPLTGCVTVAVDLDAWMLLRFDSAGHRRWLPLSRSAHAGRWHALRCALFARRAGAGTAALPPV